MSEAEDRPAERVIPLMRDLMFAINRLDRLTADAVGINTTDLACISFVEDSTGPVTAKMVSEHLGISTGATTALIDRLEQRGILARAPHPTDRRGVVLTLVPEALTGEIMAMRACFRDGAIKAWAPLSDAELRIVQRFISLTIAATEAELERSEADKPASGGR